MLSSTDIANMALGHLGVGKQISNIETEKSEDARSCKQFFNTTIQSMLRDFPWPFATVIQSLELVETDPNDEWGYSYRYPSNCLNVKRILSGSRNDTRLNRVPYKIVNDSSGQLILTDMTDAQIEFTKNIDATSHYPVDFSLAVSFRLAAYIAPRMTAGDPFKMGERAMKMYDYELRKAQSNAANEEQPDELPNSEFIEAR